MPFQIGKSGNPSGRQKERLCFDALMQVINDTKTPRPLRKLMEKLYDLASDGDLNAIKERYNRIDGLPVQVIENLNENVHYVALMPKQPKTIDAWLTNSDPETKTLTKQ